MKVILIGSCVALAVSLGACRGQEGPLEKAGERMDEAVDNVKDGDSPFRKKGVGEKAGEAIDRATGN